MRRANGVFLLLTSVFLSLLHVIVGLSVNKADSSRRNGNAGSGWERRPRVSFSDDGKPADVGGSIAPTQQEDSLAREVGETSKRRKYRLSTRPPAAPMVDSSLLRFMSTQKKQRRTDWKEEAVRSPSSGYLGSLIQGAEQLKEKLSGITVTESDSFARTDGTSDTWLGQYNRHRVARKLIELGVEETAAYEAGEVVQNHVLARMARRRVREFLKERDVLWENGESALKLDLSNSSLAIARNTTLPSFQQYGFDDVVDMMLEFGLTGNDLAAIFSHTPSVALMKPHRSQENPAALESEDESDGGVNAETLEDTITRSLKKVLCGSLKLRRYDARKVLRTCPGLLTMRGSRSAEQVVKLMCSLGVSAKSLARDKNALPVMLSRSPSALFRLVAFLSSDAVRMPIKDIGPLVRRTECADLLDALAPVPRIEQARQRSGDAVSLLWGRGSEQRREQINSAYQRMSSTAWTLRHEIGCANLGKIVSAYPKVLLLDASTQILPTAQYLMNDLGIWDDDLSRVLQLYPTLLGMDVFQMKDVVSYLLSIEVEERALASIFRAFPSLLTLDVEKDMAPVVEFLRGIGVANVGRFVTRLPPVLGYSIENELIPKWKYLSEVCLYSSFELSRFPAYFSYPLDRVIKTRYEYLRCEKRVPTQLIAVDRILRFGDKDFATQVAGDLDAAAFKRYAAVRKTKRTATKRQRQKRKASKAGNPKKS